MSFCTECGKELPDSAVFCPNCGTRFRGSGEQSDNSSATDYAAEYRRESTGFGNSEKTEYAVPYGLDRSIYKTEAQVSSARSSSKAAVVIICTVLALLIIAAVILFSYAFRPEPFIGRWTSSSVSTGGKWSSTEIYGRPILGIFELQIDANNTIAIYSNDESSTITGKWASKGNTINADFGNETLSLSYDDSADEISLYYDEGIYIIFTRSESETPLQPTTGSTTIASSGEIGDFYVAVIGAEQFVDVDNEYGVRFYYEFTNDSDHDVYAHHALGRSASQEGVELSETYTWDDSEVYGNDELYIRPGVTIRCCAEYKYDPQGGSLDYKITEPDSGESITATYMADALPGAPMPYEAESYEAPAWTLSLPAEGTIDSYHISIASASLTQDIYGAPAVRVFYEYTNNSNEALSLDDALYTCCYQDGIELRYTSDIVNEQSDEDYFVTVEPGETAIVSCVFLLRNELSPVEAEAQSYESYDAVGQTYPVK